VTVETIKRGRSILAAAVAVGAVLLAFGTATTRASTATQGTAPPPPSQDPFYRYDGATPLKDIAPGTVLKSRTIDWHVAGISLPITVNQLLCRSTTALGAPTVNVTSVLLPPVPGTAALLVAYNSFYDSTTTEDDPSCSFSGAPYDEGRQLTTLETGDLSALLLSGDTVSVADTEGEQADFATGPEYGMLTLDGIRAALPSPLDDLTAGTPVAPMGYSGGAIATGWRRWRRGTRLTSTACWWGRRWAGCS
jgi:hypothetical protein